MTLLRRLATGKNPKGLFRCDICGKDVESNLYRGAKSKSCRKCSYKLRTTHASKNSDSPYEYVRLGSKTRLYSIWRGMKSRCHNANSTSYKWYGAKGITVCDEWRNDYKAFAHWAIEKGGYDTDKEEDVVLTIDRIDSSIGYNPENCKFIEASDNIAKRNVEHSTQVHVYNLAGEYFKSFDSMTSAGKELNINVSNISKAIDEVNARCSGFMFRTVKHDSIPAHEILQQARKYDNRPIDVFIYANGASYGSFADIYKFANEIDANIGHLVECANGKRKFVKGFVVSFQDNVDDLDIAYDSVVEAIARMDKFYQGFDTEANDIIFDRISKAKHKLDSILTMRKLRTKE